MRKSASFLEDRILFTFNWNRLILKETAPHNTYQHTHDVQLLPVRRERGHKFKAKEARKMKKILYFWEV